MAVFKEARVYFSVGGKVFTEHDPVIFAPLEDTIFEEPRNVSVKLHRRVARFVRVQMSFASKWIMLSEVSFDSSVARGNYTEEVVGKDETAEANMIGIDSTADDDLEGKEDRVIAAVVNDVQHDEEDGGSEERRKGSTSDNPKQEKTDDESAFMPIIIGVLTAVILVLAAVIFCIVSRTRQRRWLNVPGGPNAGHEVSVNSEKMALNGNVVEAGGHVYPFTYVGASDTGSSGASSRGNQPHLTKLLDDNYNTPLHHQVPSHAHLLPSTATPLSLRSGTAVPTHNLFSVSSRNGSVHSTVTPMGSRKHFPPVPRLAVPPPPTSQPPLDLPSTLVDGDAVYAEPGPYQEPYRAMRYSPYYGYGPVCSEIEDSLMKQSLLSGMSSSRLNS